jgi:hypothetical protein
VTFAVVEEITEVVARSIVARIQRDGVLQDDDILQPGGETVVARRADRRATIAALASPRS